MRVWSLDTRIGRINHGRALYRVLVHVDALRRAREAPVPWPAELSPLARVRQERDGWWEHERDQCRQQMDERRHRLPSRERRNLELLTHGRRQPKAGRWTLAPAPWREPLAQTGRMIGNEQAWGRAEMPEGLNWMGIAACLLFAIGLLVPLKLGAMVVMVGAITGPKLVGVGTVPNDGLGDPARTAFQTANANQLRTMTSAAIYNAGVQTFTGTAPQRITACNALVLADGGDATFVPKAAWDGLAMLPYDASLVTFNNAVRMVREGQGNWDELDVKAYGAAGNDSADDYDEIQAALNAAQGAYAVTGRAAVVRFPPGIYRTSKPLWVKEGTRLVGSGVGFNNTSGGASKVVATFAGGPIFAVQHSTAQVNNLTTALVSGTGQAWNANNNNRWFNLRDLYTLELHGLSQFCVETFFKGTGGFGHFVGSQGKFLSSDSFSTGVQFDNEGGAALRFGLNLSTSGAVNAQSAPTGADNVLHHIAGTYDGTTLRLFLDGTQLTSTAGTGTLVQNTSEDVTLGLTMSLTPDQSPQGGNPSGVLDSVRISNTARYTANFTAPTSKFLVDDNTLALCNFDEFIGAYMKVKTKNGDAWVRQRDINTSYAVVGFSSDGLSLDGNGGLCSGYELSRGSHNWSIENAAIYNCRNAIYVLDGYGWHMRRLYINGGGALRGRYGIVLGGGAGIGKIDTVWLQSLQVGLYTATGIQVDDAFVQIDEVSYSGLVYCNVQTSQIPIMLRGAIFNTEPGVSSRYRASSLFGSNTLQAAGVVAESCVWETASNKSHFITDNLNVSVLTGCNFVKNGSPPSVMSVLGTPTQPVLFTRCNQQGGVVPWSDVAGTATVGHLGKLSAITFSATPTFDASLRDSFEITLTGNVTSSTLSNVTPGQRLTFRIIQDATGSRTFVFPTNVKGAGTISAGANTVSVQEFEVGLDSNAYAVAAMVTGM